ncbi:asparagine--tRNA ligase [Malassezia yamatoensis]|uniref:asparagine--tRNA ligase n=1 Tax=Malassezia yamatoensis TaxID=253288 RepID=A0AAJ5YNJ4_9BASI|nr:asparagine--tRNA ligase [Malassezia yamatoensis]
MPARAVHGMIPPTLSKIMHDTEHASELQDGIRTETDAWVASTRRQKKRTFLELTDGTLGGSATLQAIIMGNAPGVNPGVALRMSGLMRPGRGKRQDQKVELHIDDFHVLASTDLATYPLAQFMHRTDGEDTIHEQAAEIVRRESHLKPRTVLYGALSRIRTQLELAMEIWFTRQDFTKVYPPIITSSDCEGGGEIFRIVADSDVPSDKAVTSQELSAFWSGSGAYLSVSTQLHLEAYALGLSRVYALCPSFRAEGSATNRHLAEFWMCEAEMAWTDRGPYGLDIVMDSLESMLKFMVQTCIAVQEHDRQSGRNQRDWSLLYQGQDPYQAIAQKVGLDRSWPRITYTEAIQKIRSHSELYPDAFQVVPVWGDSLRSEHERWLATEAEMPVFVTDYPTIQKPFYMRENQERVELNESLKPNSNGEEGVTVACFDLLVPQMGELAGGSLREERKSMLHRRMQSLGMDPSSGSLQWYTDDLRRYGGAPHGGYGLGMERFLSWITGMDNVRDIVGFPRVKGHLRY